MSYGVIMPYSYITGSGFTVAHLSINKREKLYVNRWRGKFVLFLHFRYPWTHCLGHGCYSTTDPGPVSYWGNVEENRAPNTHCFLETPRDSTALLGTASAGWPWSVNGAALYQLSRCQSPVRPAREERSVPPWALVRPMCQQDTSATVSVGKTYVPTRHKTVKLHRLPGVLKERQHRPYCSSTPQRLKSKLTFTT